MTASALSNGWLGAIESRRRADMRLWIVVALLLGGCATGQTPGGDDPEAVIGVDTAGARTLLLYPVRGGQLSSTFGPRPDPFTGELRFHEGIDLAAALESPVRAAGDGVVVTVGPCGGFGQYIRIRHDDRFETAYGHIGRYADGLEPGEPVHKGDVIGYVGSTGRSTGPHLHYEILVDGHQVDPLTIGPSYASGFEGKALGALAALGSGLAMVRDKVEATGNDLLGAIEPTLATLGVSDE